MISQIYGILPSDIPDINIKDYQILQREFANHRLLPQRMELQSAYIPYMMASMFGQRGMGHRDILDFMVYNNKDKTKSMDRQEIMNNVKRFGKKSTKQRKWTEKEIADIEYLEQLMLETGY